MALTLTLISEFRSLLIVAFVYYVEEYKENSWEQVPNLGRSVPKICKSFWQWRDSSMWLFLRIVDNHHQWSYKARKCARCIKWMFSLWMTKLYIHFSFINTTNSYPKLSYFLFGWIVLLCFLSAIDNNMFFLIRNPK